jgi:hypothetical protein
MRKLGYESIQAFGLRVWGPASHRPSVRRRFPRNDQRLRPLAEDVTVADR